MSCLWLIFCSYFNRSRAKRQCRRAPKGQCSVGTQACCDSIQKASTPQAQQALGSIGAQAAPDVLVGLTCSPIGSGSEWLVNISFFTSTFVLTMNELDSPTQPACCNSDSFSLSSFYHYRSFLLICVVDTVVALGCDPIPGAQI